MGCSLIGKSCFYFVLYVNNFWYVNRSLSVTTFGNISFILFLTNKYEEKTFPIIKMINHLTNEKWENGQDYTEDVWPRIYIYPFFLSDKWTNYRTMTYRTCPISSRRRRLVMVLFEVKRKKDFTVYITLIS